MAIFKAPKAFKAPSLPSLQAGAMKATTPKPAGVSRGTLPAGHPGAPAQPAFRAKLSTVKTDRGSFRMKSNRPGD